MDKEFEKEILERLIRIETKLDDYDRFKSNVEDLSANAKNNERRIAEIEDKIKWLTRTITGSLITGIVAIGFIIVKLGLHLQ